jgi:PadR family transcriptional regulator, regulatory protein PadR
LHKKLLKTKKEAMAESIENIKSQMKKGVLELCIMSLLCEQEAYPSDLVEQLKQANLPIPEGTLYPMLTRLKNAEYLSYRWVESTEGPPRKYFSLTQAGEIQLHIMLDSWKEIEQSVKKITSRKK